MRPDMSDDELTPAGFKGGQGRSAEDVEDSGLMGGLALLGLILVAVAACCGAFWLATGPVGG